MTRSVAALALAIAVALLACACAGAPSPAVVSASSAESKTWERPGLGGAVRPEMGSPQPGEAAPELVLPDLAGRSVSLASMRGSWVVVHFTATWCPFCDTEIAHFDALADAYAGRGVRAVIVDVGEEAATWHAYAAKHVAPSVVALHDASGTAAARFAPPRAQPSFDNRAQAVLDATLIIDPQGKIRLFLLPDSAHFDPTFRGVRGELDRLLPEPVVAVTADAEGVAAGAHGEVAVSLRIARGYHVMSDHPTEPSYVPTRVTLEPAGGITSSDARYPASSAFSLGERSIATFAGTVDVRVPFEVAKDAAPGERKVAGTVRYQACTETRCLFPTSIPFAVTLRVR